LANGQSYEGIGLAPEVAIKNTVEEINVGIDRVLQYAVDELK
jgi:carboxyl-terminal processing protease